MDQQRILLFSYGSGCVAALYSLSFNFTPDNASKYTAIRQSSQRAYERLDARIKYSPEQFTEILDSREQIVRNGGYRTYDLLIIFHVQYLQKHIPLWNTKARRHRFFL